MQNFLTKIIRPLHGDKSWFDPVQAVVHNSETSGCNYCPSFFLFYFAGTFREIRPQRQILRDILHTWLLFKLVSQSSEGDNDLLSV